MGLAHHVNIQLISPAANMLAAPTTASFVSSHRFLVTPWVHAN